MREQGEKPKKPAASRCDASAETAAMANKHFSREEAEQLLPVIKETLKQAQAQKQTFDALQAELTNAASRIMVLGGSFPPYSELVNKKRERDQMSAAILETLAKIQETGCVVKDLEEGLVDFPSVVEGQEAFLCWKLGEKRIEYWHGLEEGFAGRKRLDSGPSGGPPSGPTRIQ